MTKMASKCLDLLARSTFRDELYKAASREDFNKEAGLGKVLFWGGLFGAPFAMNKLQQMQQESFLKGQSAATNLLRSIYAAQYDPQGAFGVPQQYRQQFGLQSPA